MYKKCKKITALLSILAVIVLLFISCKEPHQHDRSKIEIIKEPTHTESGIIKYTCICGESFTESTPTIAHNYTSKIIKEPTHTEYGTRVYTCECGYSYTSSISKTSKHNYINDRCECGALAYEVIDSWDISKSASDSVKGTVVNKNGNYILKISGYGNMRPTGVLNYSNKEYEDRITQIEIGENITSIGDGAFKSFDGITEVNIPNKVISIGTSAFYQCSNLRKITIGESVKTIGNLAFCECKSLTEINFNAINMDDLSERNFSAFLSVGKNTNGTKVNIGNQVKRIPNQLFCVESSGGDPKITEIKIGTGVESIGDHAFSMCYELKEIIIPNNVISIGKNAFYLCEGLTKVTIGEGVRYINEAAFSGCSSITEMHINAINLEDCFNSLYTPFHMMGSEKGINLIFGDKVRRIPACMFYDTRYLSDVTIGENVESIGESAFKNCDHLKKVTFKNTQGWCVTGFYGTYDNVDVTNPEINAKNLANWSWYRK